ncbi:type II 3-dehydroquinate dehydratase [Hydrogenophaga soli]
MRVYSSRMQKILILNGPNLNLLGTREPEQYGRTTLADVEESCRQAASRLGYAIECFQSNWEGALIDKIHEYGRLFREGQALGCVFNPGALTHTSIALHDAIKGVDGLPVIECHISNVHAREAFRHQSWVSPVASGIVVGFGVEGYLLALEGLVRKHGRPPEAESR